MSDCNGHPAEKFAEHYVLGTLSDGLADQFEEHFFQCDVCQAHVQALQMAREEWIAHPPARKRLIPWPLHPVWSIAAAASLLVAVSLLYWRALPHTSPASQPVARLRDGTMNLALNSKGQLSGTGDLAENDRNALRTAMLTGRLDSGLAAGLAAPVRETMLGKPDAAPPFKVLSPAGSVLLTDRPTFSWEALAGALGYRVAVYGAGYRKVAESPLLHQTTWQSAVALPRGAAYTWTVTSQGPQGMVRVPSPPQPEAAFTIMAAEPAAALQSAAREHAGDPLLLAVLYARAGAVDDAHAQLERLAAQNPGSKLVADLEASLTQAARP